MFSLLVLMVLGCLSQEAWSCTCGQRHPQSVYCDSAFVIKAKFVAQKEMKNDERLQYQVKTTKVFKAPKELEDIQYVYTAKSDSLCGYRHASTNKSEEFLVAGYIVGQEVFINSCSFIAPWSSLSFCQKRGFMQVYAKNCDCQIKHCYQVPCEVDNKLQCLWTDPLRRMKDLYSGHQAAKWACVHNGDDLCVWDSLKSHLYSMVTKSNSK
ncbi:metalloproteinase inhibitor 1 [Hyperolius riggenbachi]|uniref:metalloproteinase inhibitor 1 n=1 Tax=Hyperolius riggenbachi TaxID=752182 RepID=UPI0035A35D67